MRTLALVVVVFFVGTPLVHAQPAAWADKLFGGELTHDFGVVPRGSQLKHTFKMTNIWTVPLDITKLEVSCGCLKAAASTKSLQPGETATLHVHMDATKFVGQKVIRVAVTVGPKYISTATLTVSANAQGDVRFTPANIEFGNLDRGQMPTRTIDIEYAGSLPNWRVTEIVKNASAPFELKVDALPGVAASKGFRIFATIRADASPGPFKQEVLLKTTDPASPVLSFQIAGNIQAGLAVSPSPLVLRDLKVGESQTKKVFVRAARPFRITAVEGQGEGITVDLPAGQDNTQVLTVHVNALKAGELRKTLIVRTSPDSDATPLVIQAVIEP